MSRASSLINQNTIYVSIPCIGDIVPVDTVKVFILKRIRTCLKTILLWFRTVQGQHFIWYSKHKKWQKRHPAAICLFLNGYNSLLIAAKKCHGVKKQCKRKQFEVENKCCKEVNYNITHISCTDRQTIYVYLDHIRTFFWKLKNMI